MAQRTSREGETLVKRVVSQPRLPADQPDQRRRDPGRHRRLPAHGSPRRRPAAPVHARRTDSCAASSRSSGSSRRPSSSSDRLATPGKGNYNRFVGSLKIGLNGVIGFSTALLSLSTFIGFVAAIRRVRDRGRVRRSCRSPGNTFPVGNPTIVILILLIGGHPAHLPRHHGPVRRADLRRGEAASAVRRRSRRRLRCHRRQPDPCTVERDATDRFGMSDDYTIADHEFRDDDVYALGKYQLTSRWLRTARTPAARSSTSDAAPVSSTRWRSSSGSRCTASSPTRRRSPSRSRICRRSVATCSNSASRRSPASTSPT